ncbi:MAG: hypothetical protein PHY29_06875 [Syntrophales bacterium]|nr:hypothetical protein [Syntrophales bacterium]
MIAEFGRRPGQFNSRVCVTNLPPLPEGLASSLDEHKVVLVTGHRRESW